MNIRKAPFALRIVRRHAGDAAILYRRTLNPKQEERLIRVGAISPLAFSAGGGLLREAVRAVAGKSARLSYGPFHPLDPDWGARVACYTRVASGLRNAQRLHKAAEHLRQADGAEAAWWFGLIQQPVNGRRAARALRILLEAVK